MYYPNQVIYDRDKKKPIQFGDNVWDVDAYPERHTHFIECTGLSSKEGTLYEVFLPKSVEEAKDLLEKGLISPAAVPPTHCWRCGNWKTNCKAHNCVEGLKTK